MTSTGGLILCGGRSSRMGHDKATLRMGGETLLERVLARMRQVAGPVVVSLAAGAEPPPLPPGVLTSSDERPEEGPLFGLLAGFRALAGRAEQLVVMPVDMPFLTVPWLERLVAGLAGHRACLFRWQEFDNALTAAYRLDLLPKLERLVAEERRRPMFLKEGEPTRVISVEEHWLEEREPPPLMDVDTPEDYRRALLLEGIGNPAGAPVTVELEAPPGQGEQPWPGVQPLVPLFAATAEEALGFLWRLFPEWGDRPGYGKNSDAALALLPDRGPEGRSENPLTANHSLQPGDRLRLKWPETP